VSGAPRTTLVVFNHNGRELLDEFLPSVLAQDVPALVLLVDDGSSDGSLEHVRARWPDVPVLALEGGRGIAATFNAGLRACQTELIALLNNDVALDPGWLRTLEATLDAHPRAASATGKLLRARQPEVIDAAGDVLMWSSAVTGRGCGERDHGQYDASQEVFAACAAAALYRREAFEEVGPFDESLGSYLEDVDWGARARLAGYGCRYEPGALGRHLRGATTGRSRSRFVRLQRRNQLLVILKFAPASALARHAWKIAANQLLVGAAAVRDGMVADQLWAWGQVARALPATLRTRRRLQRARRVDVRELDRAIRATMPPPPLGGLLFELAPVAAGRRQGLDV
jgi:hypothetical protein